MAHEEAFLVVVSIDKPARYTVGVVTVNLTCVWVEHIHTINLDLNLTDRCIDNFYVWLSEDDKKVTFTSVFKVVSHMEVGVHAGLEDGDAAEFVELRSVGVVIEGAGDQHVEVCVCGFAYRGYEIGARNGAEFRADEDTGAFLRARNTVAFKVGSLGADKSTGPWFDFGEVYVVFFVRLLNAGGSEVGQYHLGELLLFVVPLTWLLRRCR